MLIFIPFYLFMKNSSLNVSNIPQDLSLSNMVRKTNFLSFSVLVSEIVTFMSNKKSSLRISPKILKTTEKQSLAGCGSLCGEKQFLLIFIPFYLFNQKKSLNISKFSTGYAPFKLGKKNKLSEFFSARF